MGLILSTKANTHNFNQLITLKEPVSKEAVITDLAQICLEESAKARLGWGHTFKRFVATTSVYTFFLTAPIAALLGSLWAFADKIALLATLENLCIAVPSLGGLFAADAVFGKVFGIRPVTSALLIAFDSYRNGVKELAGIVKEGYTNEEEAVKELLKGNKKALIKELKAVYSQIAKDLESHDPKDIQTLRTQLPLIEKGLVSIGLTRIEVAQILSPLKTELKLLQKSTPQIESTSQKSFWSLLPAWAWARSIPSRPPGIS